MAQEEGEALYQPTWNQLVSTAEGRYLDRDRMNTRNTDIGIIGRDKRDKKATGLPAME